MQWYYAEGNQRKGPVNQDEFNNLVGAGTIDRDTLVWRDGMPDWKPYGELLRATMQPAASVTAAAPAAAVAGQRSCAECGNLFDADEMVQYGSQYVCATCKPIFFQRIQEGAPLRTEMRYGGFWIRFVAKFADGVLIQIVNFAIGLTLGLAVGPSDPTQFTGMDVILMIISYVIYFGYNTWFVGRYGATPGKMALGLKIVRSDGSDLTYARAFGRVWAEILSGLTLLLGYIIAAFDAEKRALHDHICDTRVIRVR